MTRDGHTQAQIAEATGIDQGTVSRNMHSRQLAGMHNRDATRPAGAKPRAEILSNGSVDDVALPGPPVGPFGKFEASIRGFYRDIGNGTTVPRAVRDMASHCRFCFQAAQAGDEIPDELLVLLGDFVRDSKDHVV